MNTLYTYGATQAQPTVALFLGMPTRSLDIGQLDDDDWGPRLYSNNNNNHSWASPNQPLQQQTEMTLEFRLNASQDSWLPYQYL